MAGAKNRQHCNMESELERILRRPEKYIGSVEKQFKTLWVYENNRIIRKSINYVPGLYKIFDQILLILINPKSNSVKVTIDVESNSITVFSTGIHQDQDQEEGLYGAKLTNIFSSLFVVETADAKTHSKQVFSDNMRKKSDPIISKCGEKENWTRITFKPDLARFNMTSLNKVGVVDLMKRRVIDIAGCLLGKKVKLDGQKFQFKSFSEYCQLYMNNSKPLPRFVEHVHDKCQICICPSDGQFQQVSFVNSISTFEGGTHVDFVTDKIATHLVNSVKTNGKMWGIRIAHVINRRYVKKRFWVFVNAFIDGPVFDSHTWERMILPSDKFGSSWDVMPMPEFLDRVAKSDIMKKIKEWAKLKLFKDEAGESKNKMIPVGGHVRAFRWGEKKKKSADSDQCTLILTQGSAAKTQAKYGLSIAQREIFGVFPLRRKLPNVSEESDLNAELIEFLQILGLEIGVKCDDVKSLKYRHVMIMANQDHDGSHFKGLLINLFHTFWPELLKASSLLQEFIAPIVKAEHSDETRIEYFYTMPEYEIWKRSLGTEAKKWTIKYYNGLETCTHAEVVDYFQNLDKHKKDFFWEGDEGSEAIELAFSKKKIEARTNWLLRFKPGTYLDHTVEHIKYCDFVNQELVYHFIADSKISIPSMVDGLKPGQRKILFSLFKSKSVDERYVEEFCCKYSDQCLASTIIGMAQDYVGSNNINLLLPKWGLFGSRYQGGKDHGEPRYLCTQLSSMTRLLFPEEDDMVLTYSNEVGRQSEEPIWYVPIIPMVLINGSEGIGTALNSSVPNYNPFDVIANIKRLLNKEPTMKMSPWYKGFNGFIKENTTEDTGASYTIIGKFEEVDKKTLKIIDLPIRMWTQDYEMFLKSVSADEDKSLEDTFVQEFCSHSDGETVHFSVCMSEERLSALKKEELLEKLKLTTTVRESNMHLIDSRGLIKKYETPDKILEEFFHVRRRMYKARKGVLLANLRKELLKCKNKIKLLKHFRQGRIKIIGLTKAEWIEQLKSYGIIDHSPKKENISEVAVAGLTNEDKESVDNSSDYDYLPYFLLSVSMDTMKELEAEQVKLEKEVDYLERATVKTLWTRDLDALEVKLNEEPNKYQKECKAASENTRTETEVGEIKKPRGKAAAQKKAPADAKKKARAAKVTATTDEDDDHTADLRQRKRKRKRGLSYGSDE